MHAYNTGITNKRRIMAVFIASGIVLIVGFAVWDSLFPTWYGYVVGEDRRIYMVNLETGELEWVSRELEQVREPSEIDINREESILYIGSSVSALHRIDYTPLIAVRLNESVNIVFEVPLNSQAGGGGHVNTSHGVTSVRLGPHGKRLYVGVLDSDNPTAVLDPSTGGIVGTLRRPVQKWREFSPDGKMAASIFPGGSRMRDSDMVEYQGLVSVLNLDTGEGSPAAYLDNNRGLYPPWGSEDDHFIYLRDQPRQDIYRLEVYDRESGEVLAAYDDFSESTRYNQRHVTRIPGSDNVVMSTGYEILVFNGLTAELVKRIQVADDVRFTEVVVTDKPIDID